MKSTVNIVCGRTLRVGEVPKKGDARDIGYGMEPVPEPLIGHTLQKGHAGVFIRATNDVFPRKRVKPGKV